MKNNLLKEIAIGGVLIFLLLFLLNPFSLWMPPMLVVGILAVALILFGIYASFILREKVIDEREYAHRLIAGRVAYILGSIILIAGITFQEIFGKLDGWIVLALVAMIISKLIARRYFDSKQ